MSLFCSISGTQPLHPVVSSKSGHVYEKELILKALANNDGKDPITAEQLAEDDLIEVKTAPGQPTAPPRAPTFTSVPSLLHTLQQEWDSTMLECLELRRESHELRQELSHALYKEDAAMRVLARVTRERDEAREALASVQATLGPGYQPAQPQAAGGQDTEMDVEGDAAAQEGLPADAKQRVEQTVAALSATRKKRKPSPDAASVDEVKAFAQGTVIPSVHTTKPPGVSALTLAKNGELFVSGGMDKGVIVFDRSTSKPIATLKGHTKKVTSVLASTTETEAGLPSFVVSASLDKSVRVWTPNGKKTAYECSTNLSLGAEVNALALHPSNSLVVAALADGSWVVIDVQAPESASVILTGGLPSGTAEGTANTAAAFHPDGGMFGLGSSDAKIRVYEISTAKCAAEFEGHPGAAHGVSSLSFSENGYTLASAAQGSNQVKIWDLRKLSNSANIDVEGATAVAFDPSAQFLAVVGTDARVYAYKSWELLVQNDDNSAELTSAAWGPDAHELVVAGLDRSVRVLTRAEASA
ncbi:hypothetical protein C6P46_000391 [Rhodotorula mucilaginosa]|uniref:Pre-mRNA-processing factor 19 n=1 Tax=Rhodotorula mucilaginosa TaxID=5537 RepID=A0A9P7B3C8_RHOMI|nr:hypothetical protein C6P46_000391 [Rhodotorula mucilaginosa]TKA56047.1 hypothetical protein B0A53_01750 [Rhodotorula sp. CCFEE 5036]